MKKFKIYSDIGSVKIYSKDMATFFSNGFGDGAFTVTVYNKKHNTFGTFLQHFTVKNKDSVFLSSYDCEDNPIYTFPIGRYFVYRTENCNIEIIYTDSDIHA